MGHSHPEHQDPLQQERLSLLSRTQLASAGLTDDIVRKAYKRLDEGLDATSVKEFFNPETGVVKGATMVDFTERRMAATEVLKLADHYPSRLDLNLEGQPVFILKGLDSGKV